MSDPGTLEDLKARALREIGAATGAEALEAARIAWLGRKSELMGRMKTLGALSPDDRRAAGALLNAVKASLEDAVRSREGELGGAGREALDVTWPGRIGGRGSRHPIPLVMDEIVDAFRGMGFDRAEGPEVVTESDNFDFLNTAADHPARDMQDTFYVAGAGAEPAVRSMLRSHTSAMWRAEMERREPPLHMVFPGRVYRRDPADATHSPVFHQVEGLWVDDRCSFADLKGVLAAFLRGFFGGELGVRFEPRFFPFTEPSTEVSIECTSCRGQGCRACGRSGWLEILGAGMVHPKILAAAGPRYSAPGMRGFAFGMGVERLAMLKYRIADMRWLYDNDLRVLAQVRD